jgi:hypothetical protein
MLSRLPPLRVTSECVGRISELPVNYSSLCAPILHPEAMAAAALAWLGTEEGPERGHDRPDVPAVPSRRGN